MPESYDYIKFLASFFIIIIFIYAAYYYIMNFTSFNTVQKGGEIEIKERKILGKNRSLLIVKVKNRSYLISSDESGIRVIDRWEEG